MIDTDETSSISIPNICEEVSIEGGPIGVDAIDEQKLLGNDKKYQNKAPTTCKLLKKTTARNYWTKAPLSFLQVSLINSFIIFKFFSKNFLILLKYP